MSMLDNFTNMKSGAKPSPILVPTWVQQEIELEARKRAEAATLLATTAGQGSATAAALPPSPPKPDDLAGIRRDPAFDLADAQTLCRSILSAHKGECDPEIKRFGEDFFVATCLHHIHTQGHTTWAEVLEFMIDPRWDRPQQIFIQLECLANRETPAGRWVASFAVAYKFQSIAYLEKKTVFAHRLVSEALHCWRAATSATHPKRSAKRASARAPAELEIFSKDAIDAAAKRGTRAHDHKADKITDELDAAYINSGKRSLPDARKAIRNLDRLAADFENLSEPIDHLKVQLALASAMPPEEFRLSPILLLGEPGIGKTYLAMQLAEALGVPMEKVSGGSDQASFSLTGSHPSWNNAMVGAVFSQLAHGSSAAPVFLIDEVDKIGNQPQAPMMPALLDLLEPTSARVFKDAFLGIPFDASRIIYVLTANELRDVPEPLQSRCTVFTIPRPKVEQRLRIIEAETARLCKKTKKRIRLDASAQSLAQAMEVDIRQTLRAVQEGFTKAMMAGQSVAQMVIPQTGGRRPIGFLSMA